jgi:hypothetical protein
MSRARASKERWRWRPRRCPTIPRTCSSTVGSCSRSWARSSSSSTSSAISSPCSAATSTVDAPSSSIPHSSCWSSPVGCRRGRLRRSRRRPRPSPPRPHGGHAGMGAHRCPRCCPVGESSTRCRRSAAPAPPAARGWSRSARRRANSSTISRPRCSSPSTCASPTPARRVKGRWPQPRGPRHRSRRAAPAPGCSPRSSPRSMRTISR